MNRISRGEVYMTTEGKYVRMDARPSHSGTKFDYELVDSLHNATVFQVIVRSAHYGNAEKLFGSLLRVKAELLQTVRICP